MQVRISTRHGHLSDPTQGKITSKVDKLVRIFDRLTAIEVIIDLENEEAPHVDIKANAEHKHDFVASDRSTSLMASVDGAVHKLEQQLRKYKEKVQERHRQPGTRHEEIPLESESDAQ